MKTTAKELRAEIETVKDLSNDSAIKKICDVLIDVVNALEQKGGIGFKQ